MEGDKNQNDCSKDSNCAKNNPAPDQHSRQDTEQPSSSDPGQQEFLIALIFSDEDLAKEVKKDMNDVVLNNGKTIKILDYNDPYLGGCIIRYPRKFTSLCDLMLVVMTDCLSDDSLCGFMIEEAISLTRCAQEQNGYKYRIRLLHTKSKKERTSSYRIPDGFASVGELNWFGSERQKHLTDQLNHLVQEKTNCQNTGGQVPGGLLSRMNSRNENCNGSEGPESSVSAELKRITYESNMILQRWQKELFCPTFAARKAKEILRLKGCVFITGRSGDGKTSLVYHILTDLKKEKTSFQPYIITEPEDMKHIPPKNSVVFVDNIFGASHFSSILLEKWRVWFQCIEAYVDAGDMYFIATSPCHVRDECDNQLGNIPILGHLVDMAGDYSLGMHEKDNMLTEYLESKGLDMKEKTRAIHSKLLVGFPQCCKLYVTNLEAQKLDWKFFENPFLFLNAQISEFKTGDKIAHMVLVLCFYEKGRVSTETLNPFTKLQSAQSSVSIIKSVCGIPENITIGELGAAADKLCIMGYLRYHEEKEYYEFSHQSIYDAVCISFGKVKGCVTKLIELCPLNFLVDNIALAERDSSEKEKVTFVIPQASKNDLFNRIISELRNGNVRIFEHNIFTNEESLSEIFNNENFTIALTEMLRQCKSAVIFVIKRTLYFLSASMKYTGLVSKMIDTIRKILKGRHAEELSEDIFKDLLHQCLEGSCTAGNYAMFQKVMKLEDVKPCNKCCMKAVESPVDQPKILSRLLLEDSFFSYVNISFLIKNLVKMKKVESLKTVFKSAKKKFFQEQELAFELFRESCETGNYEMFQLLQKNIQMPDCKEELILRAVSGGNRAIIESLLTEENQTYVDKRGRTFLHHACKKRLELCAFFISRKIDHSITDKKGLSALHLACHHLDTKSVENLIYRGLEVTVPILSTQGNLRRLSPLHMAAKNNKGSSLVELLIQEGPKGVDMVNCRDLDGLTPLHIAAQRPRGQSMIDELLKKKAEHKTKDDQGKTALHRAADANLPHNIQSLLRYDVDVNSKDKKGRTPLHHALSRRISIKDEMDAQMDSVDQLLTKGADVSLADEEGNTCVHTAAEFDVPPKILEKITEKGGDQIALNAKGMSPLHLVFKPHASLKSVNLLISKYPKLLKTSTKDGKSVLHVALDKWAPYSIIKVIFSEVPSAAATVAWEDISLFKSLKQYKSEQVVHFLQQCTEYFPAFVIFDIMQVLCYKKMSDELWTEAMDLLNGEDFKLSEKKYHSHMYKVLDSPSKIQYFIDKGVAVNVTDEQGNTPLHIAALQGSDDGVKILLGAGAHVNKLNNKKESVLHLVICPVHIMALSEKSLFERLYYGQFIQIRNHIAHRFAKLINEYSIKHVKYWNSSLRPDSHSTVLSTLLQNNSVVNVRDSIGFTPLLCSVHDINLLNQLVDAGADLELTTEDGWSCLHSACLMRENVEIVKFLLDKGLSPCMRDSKGTAPIHVALLSRMSDVETIRRLAHCTHDKTVCHCEEQWPFLHMAAACCVKEIVEMFIEQTPEMLFKEDKEGTLPIHHAVAGGDIEIVRLVTDAMMTAGVHEICFTEDCDGCIKKSVAESTKLTHATNYECLSKDREREKTKHADQRTVSDLDTGTFDVDDSSQNQMTLQQLLKPWEEAHGDTILHTAARHSSPEMLKYLLKEGFGLNKSDDEGNTPLHIALRYGSSCTVDYLLKARAETDSLNREGQTPLFYALMFDEIKPENILNLVTAVDSVKMCSMKKKNPLHLVCESWLFAFLGQRETLVFPDPLLTIIVKLFTMLIDKGCDVNARDEDGQTPLHLAAAANSAVFVDILLDYEANIDAEDNQGRTPLTLALDTSTQVIDFSAALRLVKRGATPCTVTLDMLRNMKRPLLRPLELLCKHLKITVEEEKKQ